MTNGAEARGARARRHAGRRRRPLHAGAVAAGIRRRSSARCSSSGCTSSEVWVGANFLFGHDRAGNVHRAAHARRALRVSRREDRSGPLQGLRRQQHAHPAAGRRKDGSTRRARCSATTTSSTAPSRRGAGRGRELGFPTANLATANELLPPAGVYATTATIDGVVHPSMTNIGMRPTFGDVDRPIVETHIFDLNRDLYGCASCGCRSFSGCATSARFRTSTRCARRSTPTAGARAGCSVAFRCRIVAYVPTARRAWCCA